MQSSQGSAARRAEVSDVATEVFTHGGVELDLDLVELRPRQLIVVVPVAAIVVSAHGRTAVLLLRPISATSPPFVVGKPPRSSSVVQLNAELV